MHKKCEYIALVLTMLLVIGCGKQASHDSHAHETHTEKKMVEHAVHAREVEDAHAGEAPDAHAGEAEGTHGEEKADAHAGEAPGAHEGEGEIEITPEGMKLAGITLAKAKTGNIQSYLDLSGEVGFNEDRLVHITPRFPGIAKEVHASVGDAVNAGDIVAVIEGNENLTQYPLKAPISGRIIQKHITPGEHVSETESVFLLADLSTVWVNLAVYSKDVSLIKTGQQVSITATGTNITVTGRIQYITPIIDVQTRRVTARVVLPNTDNQWRPGTFISARIAAGESRQCIVVEKEAVQTVNGETVVFISDEPNRFKPVDVTIGNSDAHYTQITAGLEAGTDYVNKGAFDIKAKIVTSALGAHAGHGH